MKIAREFREFAIKGNMLDMAVGIIIGGAFGKVVTSIVNDVIMPPIGLLLGGVEFTDLVVTLKAAQGEIPAVELRYGSFIQTMTDFLIIAITIFILVKAINTLRRQEVKDAKDAKKA